MVRPNKTSSKGTEVDGMEKNLKSEVESFRGYTEAESFIGSTTEPTIVCLAKRMERQSKEIKANSEKILHTLSKMEYNRKALNNEIEKLRGL
tara:strand:+ start:637 stop:912 length:276 start_codon:yes stop_codon:yes gene_type:complete